MTHKNKPSVLERKKVRHYEQPTRFRALDALFSRKLGKRAPLWAQQRPSRPESGCASKQFHFQSTATTARRHLGHPLDQLIVEVRRGTCVATPTPLPLGETVPQATGPKKLASPQLSHRVRTKQRDRFPVLLQSFVGTLNLRSSSQSWRRCVRGASGPIWKCRFVFLLCLPDGERRLQWYGLQQRVAECVDVAPHKLLMRFSSAAERSSGQRNIRQSSTRTGSDISDGQITNKNRRIIIVRRGPVQSRNIKIQK